MDNASVLGLGCVAGLVLVLMAGVVLLFYGLGELRQMIGRLYMALVNRK